MENKVSLERTSPFRYQGSTETGVLAPADTKVSSDRGRSSLKY
jgi:hypothetical protein